MNIWDEINADRKAAWLTQLQALESPENVYYEFYGDMQSGQGVPYAVDIVRNGNDDDYDYSVSVVTYTENLDRLILAGAWFNSDYGIKDVEALDGASVYGLQEYLVENDDLVGEYVNSFGRDIDQRLAEAITEYAGNPKGISCDIDSPDIDCWNISVGSSAETLDEVADVIMAAEDVLTYWLDDLGPGVAKAAYGVLADDEKEKVQAVLAKLLELAEEL